MPDLPVLTVTQAQLDRLVAAFPGATLTEKADAYKAWSTNNLIDFVQAVETRKIDAAADTAKATQIAALLASLPPRSTYWPV